MVSEDKMRDMFRLLPFDFTVCMLTLGIVKAIDVFSRCCYEYEFDTPADPVNQDHAAQLED